MHRLWRSSAIFLVCFATTPAFAWINLTAKKNDSINTIAAKYRPAGVSTMDMVIALRNANPEVVFKGLKPGMNLHLPSTTAEVRQAISGVRQKAAAQGEPVKAQSARSAATTAKSTKPTKATKSAKPASALVKKSSGKVAKPKESSHTVTPLRTATKPPKKIKPISVAKPKFSSPANAQSATDTTLQKASSLEQATIISLQQQLATQAQTITNDQTQIANLTGEINKLNLLRKTHAGTISLFTGLWFVLWVITMILYLGTRRKNRLMPVPPQNQPEQRIDPSFMPVQKEEPIISKVAIHSVPKQEKANSLSSSEQAFYGEDEDSRQVELDIASAIPFAAQISPSSDDEENVSGERQNIIREIANDHDNIEWHLALLEFYIKTNNAAGFNKHTQTMLGTALMSEGDTLWEKIRKMYLNTWVYKEEQ